MSLAAASTSTVSSSSSSSSSSGAERYEIKTSTLAGGETQDVLEHNIKVLKRKLRAWDIDPSNIDFRQPGTISTWKDLLEPRNFLEFKIHEANTHRGSPVAVAQLYTTPACRDILYYLKTNIGNSMQRFLSSGWDSEWQQRFDSFGKDITVLPFHRVQDYVEALAISLIKNMASLHQQTNGELRIEAKKIEQHKDEFIASIFNSTHPNYLIYQILDLPNAAGTRIARGGVSGTTTFADLRTRLEQEWSRSVWNNQQAQIAKAKGAAEPAPKRSLFSLFKSKPSVRAVSAPVATTTTAAPLKGATATSINADSKVSVISTGTELFDNVGYEKAKQMFLRMIGPHAANWPDSPEIKAEAETLLREFFQGKADSSSEQSAISKAATSVRSELGTKFRDLIVRVKKPAGEDAASAKTESKSLATSIPSSTSSSSSSSVPSRSNPFGTISAEQIRRMELPALMVLISSIRVDDFKETYLEKPVIKALMEQIPALSKALVLDKYGHDDAGIIAIRKEPNWRERLVNFKANLQHIIELRKKQGRDEEVQRPDGSIVPTREPTFDADGFQAVVDILNRFKIEAAVGGGANYEAQTRALQIYFKKGHPTKFDTVGFKKALQLLQNSNVLQTDGIEKSNQYMGWLIAEFGRGADEKRDIEAFVRNIQLQAFGRTRSSASLRTISSLSASDASETKSESRTVSSSSNTDSSKDKRRRRPRPKQASNTAPTAATVPTETATASSSSSSSSSSISGDEKRTTALAPSVTVPLVDEKAERLDSSLSLGSVSSVSSVSSLSSALSETSALFTDDTPSLSMLSMPRTLSLNEIEALVEEAKKVFVSTSVSEEKQLATIAAGLVAELGRFVVLSEAEETAISSATSLAEMQVSVLKLFRQKVSDWSTDKINNISAYMSLQNYLSCAAASAPGGLWRMIYKKSSSELGEAITNISRFWKGESSLPELPSAASLIPAPSPATGTVATSTVIAAAAATSSPVLSTTTLASSTEHTPLLPPSEETGKRSWLCCCR